MIGLAAPVATAASGAGGIGGSIFAGIASGPAAPFIMAASELVGPLTKIIKGMIQGCGQSCIDATKYADTAETYLKQLVSAYLAQPQHCLESQQATLQYIDSVLAWLDKGCRAVGGAAGQRCISERLVKGGSAPWCPTGTGCDWITLYRDPVALDRSVVNCGGGGLLGNLGGGSQGGGNTTMFLLLILVVVFLIKRKG